MSRKICLILIFLSISYLYSAPTNIIVVGNKIGVIKYHEILSDGTISQGKFVEDLGDNVWGVGCEDFNNDGLPDIVSGTAGELTNTGRVFLYINQGLNQDNIYVFNKITLASNLKFNEYMLDFGVADFNNDGYPDFVCSGNTTTPLVFINNGNNTFTMKSLPPTTYYLRGKDVGDFDEDGDVDIVVGEYSTGNLYEYLNDGSGNFSKKFIATVPNCSSPYTVAAGDFDEDGHIDIIAGGGINGETYFFTGDGNGNFNMPEDLQTPLVDGSPYGTPFDVNTYASAESWDFNNDGHLDLIIVNSSKGQILVAYGNGNGTFGLPEKKQNIGESLGISVYPDKLKPISQYPSVKIYNPSFDNQWVTNTLNITATVQDTNLKKYTLYYGESINPVVWHTIVSNNTTVQSNIIASFDTSGLNGIYTIKLVAKDTAGNVSAYKVVVNIKNKITAPVRNYVVTVNDAGEMYYFLDNEDATFGVKTFLGDIGRNSRGVGVADIDNDGDYDFITGFISPDSSSRGTVLLFVNNGENNFTKIIIDKNIYFNSAFGNIKIVDLNNDNLKDFIVVLNYSYMYIYMNNGDGTFSRSVSPNTGYYYSQTCDVGDIDNDGRLDIIFQNYHRWNYYRDTQVRSITKLNNQYQVFNELKLNGYFYDIAVNDFNNDGYNDFIISRYPGGSLELYLGSNNGNAHYFTSINLNTYFLNYISFDGYDFNKDNNVDLILYGYNEGKIYFMQGNGDGSFESPELISDGIGKGFGIGTVQENIGLRSNKSPIAFFTSPVENSELKNNINISGTAFDEKLAYYKLEIANTNNDSDWYLITVKSNAVINNQLARFDTTEVTNGFYFLKLTVVNSNNIARSNLVRVKIQNRLVTAVKYYEKFIIVGNNGGELFFFGINKTNNNIEPQAFQINIDGSLGKQTYFEDIGGGCFGVGIADFNNDGLYDFVAGAGRDEQNQNRGTIYLFENKGPYTNNTGEVLMNFKIHKIATNLNNTWVFYDFAIGDFNNDGLYDFVTSDNNKKLYFFKNRGDLSFSMNYISVPDNMYFYGKDAGDYNEDGNLDFVAVGLNQLKNIYIFYGDGNGNFNKKYLFQVKSDIDGYNITSGDFDSDGHLDIIKKYFYKGDGQGNFYSPVNDKTPFKKYAYAEPASLRSVASGLDTFDYNNDGTLDLFLLYTRNYPQAHLYVLDGSGTGKFDVKYHYEFYASSGNIDTVAIASPPKKMNNYNNYPVAQITNKYKKIKFPEISGILEISGSVFDPNNNLAYYKIMIGKGIYPIDWQTVYSNSMPVHNSTIYNFDTSAYNGIYTVKLIAIDSEGNLSGDKFTFNAVNKVSSLTNYLITVRKDGYIYYYKNNNSGIFNNSVFLGDFGGSGDYKAEIADFDNDNDSDFVLLDNEFNLYLFINDNSGHFTYFKIDTIYDANSEYIDMSVGDFNNDGLNDFIVSINNKIYLYLNNGICGFVKKFVTSVDGIVYVKDSFDINSDGNMDFIAYFIPSDINKTEKVVLFTGNGTGSFEKHDLFNANSYIYSLTVGDFNNDSFPDIVASIGENSKLYFIPGNVNNEYAITNNQQPFYNYNSIAHLDSFDFNNDNNLDLCLIRYDNGYIYVFNGKGDGNFNNPYYVDTIGGYANDISTTPIYKKFNKNITARIFTPDFLQNVSGNISITGTASCSNFLKYSVSFGKGKSPLNWNTISENSNSIVSNLLAVWNSSNFNGIYTIKLQVWNSQNEFNTLILPLNIVNPMKLADKNFILTTSAGGKINMFQIASNFSLKNKKLIDIVDDHPDGIAIADIDNDYDLDFITGDSSGILYSFINDSSNSFTKIIITNNLNFGASFNDVAFIDINHDNLVDFAAVGENNTVLFFTNAGNISFHLFNKITLQYSTAIIKKIAFADFNKDNFIDLIMSVVDLNSVEVYIFYGNNSNWFGGMNTILSISKSVVDNPYTLAVSDFDEDGNQDFIFGGGITGDTFYYSGDGTGNFSIKEDKTTPIDRIYGVYGKPFDFDSKTAAAVFDFNNDIHKDLITVNVFNEELNVIEGKGNGIFKTPVLLDFVGDSFGVGVPFCGYSDYINFPVVQISSPSNNSALKDIVEIDGSVYDSDLKYYELMFGEGENPVEWNLLVKASNSITNSKIFKWNTSDLNGIYTLKLKAVDSNNNVNAHSVSFYLNNKTIGNKKFIATVADDGSLFISTIITNRQLSPFIKIDNVSNYCRGIVQADIDNDNDDDIIVGRGINNNAGFIYIYLNNGKNVFNRIDIPINKYISYWIMDITAGDFNNNGLNDIIFCANNNRIYLLENKGNYKFELRDLNISIPYTLRRIEKIYLNRDNNLDFIASFSHYNYIGFYYGDGNFNFTQHLTNIGTDNDNYSLVVDDFDNDNEPEIVIGGGHHGYALMYDLKKNNSVIDIHKSYNIDNCVADKKPDGYAYNFGYSWSGNHASVDSYNFTGNKPDLIVQNKGNIYILKNQLPEGFINVFHHNLGVYSLAIAGPPKYLSSPLLMPYADILSPSSDFLPVKNIVPVIGNAYADNFKYYKLEYGAGRKPIHWNLIVSNNNIVHNSQLAMFDTSDLNGIYTIKLTVYNGANIYSSFEISVDIVNSNPDNKKIIAAGQANEFYAMILTNENIVNKKIAGFEAWTGVDCGTAVADFDNDGDLDILTGWGYPGGPSYFGRLALLIRHKDYSFTQIDIDTKNLLNFNNYIMDIAALDINNDSYPDFVVSGNSPQPYLFVNNKNNTFTIIRLQSADNNLRAKDIGDFNNDGYVDIAMADAGNKVYIYENDKHNNFIKLVPFTINDANDLYSLSAGDFDEDGYLDLIVGGNNGKLWFYKGDGHNHFNTVPIEQYSGGSSGEVSPVISMGTTCAIDKMDINRDSHLDLVIQRHTGEIYFAYGTGNPGFNTPVFKTSSVNGYYAISAPFVPYSKDDVPVALITEPDKKQINTIIDDKKIKGAAYTKHISDFDYYKLEYGYGDNPVDWHLIIKTNVPSFSSLGRLSVSNLNGLYTIRLTVRSKKGFTAYDNTKVNITTKKSNNKKFIVVGLETGEIYLYYDNEDGTFQDRFLLDKLHTLVYGLSVSDIDNDNDLDVLAVEKQGNIYAYINDGNQNFLKKVIVRNLSVYADAMDIHPGKFRKNRGYKDLLTSQNNNMPVIFKNQDPGELWYKAVIQPGDVISRVRKKSILDINNDKLTDFFYIDYQGRVYLYINKSRNGNSVKFTNYTLFTVTNSILPYTFISGDFDEDNIIDLIIGGDETGDAYFYKGYISTNNIINFELQPDFKVFDFNEETASYAFDFNMDGFLDIIAVTFKSNKLYYIQGKSGKEFEQPVVIDNNLPSALGIAALDDVGSFLNPYPQAVINKPSRDDNVNGIIHISGVAYDNDFKEYSLEYAKGYAPTNWHLITRSTNPVYGGELGVWNSNPLESGIYSLKLTVSDKSNQISSDFLNINLVPPRAYITIHPASPVTAGSVVVTLSNDKPLYNTPMLYYKIFGEAQNNYITLSPAGSNNDLWTGVFEISSNRGEVSARFYYVGEDDFGNVGTEILKGEYFDIDTFKPKAEIKFSVSPPFNAGYYNILLNISEELKTEPVLYFIPNNSTNKIFVNNIYPAGVNAYSGLLPITTDLSNGTAKFYFSGIDTAGNIGTEIVSNNSFFIAVDRINPYVNISSPVSNEILWGNIKIFGSGFDKDYFNTDNNFANYKLEYGKGRNPDNWTLIYLSRFAVYSNLLGIWDSSDLYGVYTVRLSAFDNTGNSSECRTTVILNNVHNFKIVHDGIGYPDIPEKITVSARDKNNSILTDFVGVVTLDTVAGSESSIVWSNISGNGWFSDAGESSDKAFYEFVPNDKGIVELAIIDSTPEILDIQARNIQAEDDDTEGYLIIYQGITLVYPFNSSVISNIMPLFKWKVPRNEHNKFIEFKIEISDNPEFNNILYSFESKNDSIGFQPVPPAQQKIGSQFFSIFKKLMYNKKYYWRVKAFDNEKYYIKSDEWFFEIKK